MAVAVRRFMASLEGWTRWVGQVSTCAASSARPRFHPAAAPWDPGPLVHCEPFLGICDERLGTPRHALPHGPRFRTLSRPRKRRFPPGPNRPASCRGRRHKPTAKSKGTNPMTTATWITMIVIMAFVWGGLTMALRTAVRKESEKSGD